MMVKLDIHQYLKDGKAGLWLVLIGIDYYQYLPALKCAAEDCIGLVKAFRDSTQSFPRTEVFYHIGKYESSPITPELIQATLSKVARQSRAQDTVLFYFAGHGVLEPKTEKLYLCLTRTQKDRLPETGLAIEDVLEQLKQSKIRRQVVILDACHSGGAYFFRSGSSDEMPEPEAINSGFTQKLDQVLQQHARYAKNLYAMLACASDERSWELPELGHGAFTYALIEGVRGKAANNNGYIEVDHLYRYVRDETERLVGKQQKPQRVVFADEDIILGHVPASLGQTAVEFMQSLDRQSVARLTKAERKDCYEKAFLGGLIREYPEISEAEQNARARLANLLELSRRKTQSIENANLLMCRVRQHERSVKRLLYIARIANQDNFIALRNRLNIDPALISIFERIEAKQSKQFQDAEFQSPANRIVRLLSRTDSPSPRSTEETSIQKFILERLHRLSASKTGKLIGISSIAAALFLSVFRSNTTPIQFYSSNSSSGAIISEWDKFILKPDFLWVTAQDLHAEGQIQRSIHILNYIPEDSNFYYEAQDLVFDLHVKIWNLAQQRYQEGKQDEAVMIAESIQANSPFYKEANLSAFEWKDAWKHDKPKFEEIEQLVSSNKWSDWVEARNRCDSLINPYWKHQSAAHCQTVLQKINGELNPQSREFSNPSKRMSPSSRSASPNLRPPIWPSPSPTAEEI